MTKDELRWILHDLDDDTPIIVSTYGEGGRIVYRDPAPEVIEIERGALTEDGKPYKTWCLKL